MMFLCQNADFRFSYKKQWFLNGFEQPTSSNFKQLQATSSNFSNFKQTQGGANAPSGPGAGTNEILKMLTVEAYRKDI